MPASRSVQQPEHGVCEDFLYTIKAGPEGGRRPPSGPAATALQSERYLRGLGLFAEDSV
jgi:hypothetical protein